MSDADSCDWAATDALGFWIKPLLDDGSRGSTALMRIDAGASADFHQHDQLEEILVLDGSFSDQDRSYGPGQYCIRAPGTSHTTMSATGATVLLVYRS